MIPGRRAFRLVLIQVDRNIEMVDQDKGDSRPDGLPESLSLLGGPPWHKITVAAGSNKKNKSLTRVISTKLSIEDYERFQKCTNFVYKS